MQLANNPSKIQLPFANGGQKNTIPVPSQISVTPGAASWTDGFPPLTMTAVTAGGVPPSGEDFNGVLNEISALSQWFSAGGAFQFDAGFASAIGGYPKGARLLNAAGNGYWLNLTDNNANNPDAVGVGSGWVPTGGFFASSVYAGAQHALATGNAKVIFDNVEFDSGLWDGSNHRFTLPYPGLYRVSGSILIDAPSGQLFATQIWKNGSLAKQSFQAPQVSTGNLSLPVHGLLQCQPGDYLEIYVVVPGASAQAGLPGSNQQFVFAQCEYLGS